MDAVRPGDLKAIDLTVSADRGRTTYLATDQRTGQILSLPAPLAHALSRAKAHLAGAAARPSEGDLRATFGVLQMFDAARRRKLAQGRRFNPLFSTFELVQMGRFEPWLRPLARAVLRPWLALAAAMLVLTAILLGARNDWAILDAFGDVFSLRALATFALIAPALKILHELGHVLAALRLGVPVRAGGVMLIGLYPMPFVDVSDADTETGRRERVLIALAGIATDVLIALIALVGWHLAEGAFWRTLLGNVFVFGTVSSVLFNANPLIKLDGYFVLSDAIGERNLSANAAMILKDARRCLTSLGAEGRWPSGRRAWLMLAYGLGSFAYKINIMVLIIWSLLPRFLGLGLVLTIWGVYATFFSPLLSPAGPEGGARAPAPGVRVRRALFWCGLAILVGVLALVPREPRLLLEMRPATEAAYALTARTAGTIEAIAPAGPVRSGQTLLRLSSPSLTDRLSIQEIELREAELRADRAGGLGEAEARLAARQIDLARERLAITAEAVSGLTIVAGANGLFLAEPALRRGAHVAEGLPFAALYPAEEPAMLEADFPERWLDRFEDGVSRTVLRVSGTLGPGPEGGALHLVEGVLLDPESGARSVRLRTRVGLAAADAASARIHLLLRFEAEPLWRHVAFAARGVLDRFRDAQIAERVRRLGDG